MSKSFNNFNAKFERLHIAAAPAENCAATVVIPARDEAENIKQTLESFISQKDEAGKPFDFSRFEIIVLANNCRDETASIVENFRRDNLQIRLHLKNLTLAPERANIGYVRRLLFNEAYVRQVARRGLILTTDADTAIDFDWLSANFEEIKNGADAVGGRILIKSEELEKMDAKLREIHLKDEEYRLKIAALEAIFDPVEFDQAPRHHQHFNGSFAVKSAVFAASGGIPDVRFLEDCAFFDSLERIDAKVRHSPHAKVRTSARCSGRTEIGLSFQLNEWKILSECGGEFLVESPAAAIEKFKLRRLLRDSRRQARENNLGETNAELSELARKLCISENDLLREIADSQTFGTLCGKVFRRASPPPLMPLNKALHETGKFNIDFSHLLPEE